MDMSLSKLGEIVKDREASYAAAHGVAKNPPWLSDWAQHIPTLKAPTVKQRVGVIDKESSYFANTY